MVTLPITNACSVRTRVRTACIDPFAQSPQTRGMRVLFTSQPLPGHFQPLVPLARAAADAGHEVAFACARSFVPSVERAGFTAFAAGFEIEGRVPKEIAPGLRDGPREDFTHYAVPHLFIGLLARVMLPDLLALCRTWQPDILVRENTEFGACVAGEMLDLRYATVRATGSSPTFYANRHALAASLGALREYAALPLDPDVQMPFRHLYLMAEPPSFSQDEVPPTTRYIRPVDMVARKNERPPAWLGDLPERPTVYATLGTVLGRNGRGLPALHSVLEGLRDEAINLIVTVGPDTNPCDFGQQPPNIHIERFIPQELLLPRCDLVLTHGGFGTVKGALSHGVPMVLLPHSADQPDNAVRCTALGVGVVVGAERSPEAIRAAVRRVLSDVSYRMNAHRVRAEIQELPGPEDVVPVLERLAVREVAHAGGGSA
jgi:UDP:flavonoid glycosyltransferase YjiC (YdhE family)